MKRESWEKYLLVLPFFLIFFGLIGYPLYVAFKLTFYQKTIGLPAIFIGVDNYAQIVQDPMFHRALLNSLVYTGGSVLGKLLLGLVMALALNEAFRGRAILRGMLMLPWIVPIFVSAYNWRWIYDGTLGILNLFFLQIGLIHEPIAWLGNLHTVMPCVIIANVWRGFPFFGISLLAGMQVIPREPYEAADVDGASSVQRFLYITIPNLKILILVVVILSTIWTFNDFPLLWILTAGGPAGVTETLPILGYKLAFISALISKGVSVAMFMLPLLGILIYILTRQLRTPTAK